MQKRLGKLLKYVRNAFGNEPVPQSAEKLFIR